MKHRRLRTNSAAGILLAVIVLSLAQAGALRASEEDARSFVGSIAETVYTWAWPTATYKSASIRSIEPVEGGYDVLLKLSGQSAFDGGDLWLVLVFELRHGTLSDIRVSDHNAILAPPFSTVKAMGELIAELAAEGSRYSAVPPQEASNGPHGFKFRVINQCRHSVQVAIDYRRLDGNWEAAGWWDVQGNTSRYLTFTNGTYALTNNSVFYGYAETNDGTLYWGGNAIEATVKGRRLRMLRLEDDEGDSEWTLRCDGS